MTSGSQPRTSHFLDRLAGRITGSLDVLEPRRPSMFEPQEHQPQVQDTFSQNNSFAENFLSNEITPASKQGSGLSPQPVSKHQSLSVSKASVALDRSRASHRPRQGETPNTLSEEQLVEVGDQKNGGTFLVDHNRTAAAAKGFQESARRQMTKSFGPPVDRKSASPETAPANGTAQPRNSDMTLDSQPNAQGPSTLAKSNQVSANRVANSSDVMPAIRQTPKVLQSPPQPAKRAAISRQLNFTAVAATEPETIVNITIGRLEVRATSQTQQSSAPRNRATTPLSLDAYLKSKAGNT